MRTGRREEEAAQKADGDKMGEDTSVDEQKDGLKPISSNRFRLLSLRKIRPGNAKRLVDHFENQM